MPAMPAAIASHIAGRHELAGLPVDHQFRVAAHIGGDHGQAAGHGFQDGIRDAFGQRRQRETIEPTHDIRHVGALAGQPGQLFDPGLREHGLRLGAQRAVADHHQAQPTRASAGCICSARTNAGASSGWALTVCMRPTVPTTNSAAIAERAARGSDPRWRRPDEALDIDPVVDLLDPSAAGHRPCASGSRRGHATGRRSGERRADRRGAATGSDAACRPDHRRRGHARRGCAPARRPARPAPGTPAPPGCGCGRSQGASSRNSVNSLGYSLTP